MDEPTYIVKEKRSMEYPNAKRQGATKAAGFSVRPNYRSVSGISWAGIPDDVVSELVRVVTRAGAAIMFGCTSDGGALSLCILDGQNKIKEYPRDETEVHNLLMWLKDEYFPTPISTKK